MSVRYYSIMEESARNKWGTEGRGKQASRDSFQIFYKYRIIEELKIMTYLSFDKIYNTHQNI